MKSTAALFLFSGLLAAATARSNSPSMQDDVVLAPDCLCPSRDFMSYSIIDVAGVQDILYGRMNELYSTTLDFFTKSLAPDSTVTVDADNDVLLKLDAKHCFHGTVTDMRFQLPSGQDVTVDLQLRSLARTNGPSVEVCQCRLGGDSHGLCPDELITYLKERTDARMQAIKAKLTSG